MTGLKIPHFGLTRINNHIREEILDVTNEVLKSGIFINGKYTKQFEGWLAMRCNAKYATVTHSGTQALELIARFAVNSAYCSNTITVPNITYPATLNAFLTTGWGVNIGDTDSNGILQYDKLYKSPNTVCVVGLYGRAPDNVPLYAIVDGAQHWLAGDNQLGMAMAISFDPTKNLYSTGNGGAVVTDDIDVWNFVNDYKNNGTRAGHINLGTNSKMSEIDCAHLLVRTQYINQWQSRRANIRKFYIDNFKNLPIRCLSDGAEYHADQKFVVEIENRDELHSWMALHNIETKIHYTLPLSQLPISRDLVKPDLLSNSVHLVRRVISLPIYPELSDTEVEYISAKVKDFFN